MSRKEEFQTGTGKANTPASDKDIFAEEPRMPARGASTVEQDSGEVGAYDAGRPVATGTGTPVKLDENGGGTTVIRGHVDVPRRFEGPVTNPEAGAGTEVPGVKRQPTETTAPGTKVTQASKAKDNASPRVAPRIEGGQMVGVDPVEREEIHGSLIADAARAAANRGPRGLRTTDLRLGELAEADPTIHNAFKRHIDSWRRRGAKGMADPHGLVSAKVKVEGQLRDKGEDAVIDHPAFRNDVTYQRVADAISGDVGDVLDHKNLDKDGNPTVRKINAGDLADFASFHRHIFGHSQHVSETMPSGEQGHYRVDPAAFSMFNLVGKHQRRGNGQRVPQINVEGTKQDAYHWMVGAVRKHMDTNATAVRRSIIMDARRERREDTTAREKMDNVTAGRPAELSDIKEAYAGGHIKAGEAADLIKTSIHTRGSYAPRSTEAIMPETRYGVGTRTAPKIKQGTPNPPAAPEKPQTDATALREVGVGQKVSHDTHGVGTVVSAENGHSMVDFGERHPVDRSPVLRRLPHHTRVTPL